MTSVKVIAHSKSSVTGTELITIELEVHRYVWAEVMTHRVFSRNAASSRAIPINKMLDHVRANMALPVHWGKKEPGMQAREQCFELVKIPTFAAEPICELMNWKEKTDYFRSDVVHHRGKYYIAAGDILASNLYSSVAPPNEGKTWVPMQGGVKVEREVAWTLARDRMLEIVSAFDQAGYHKQIVNRLIEPFQFIKAVVTTTKKANWDGLRDHEAAQPEIRLLAQKWKEAEEASTPIVLSPGQWHTPYFGNGFWCQQHVDEDTSDLDDTYLLDEALMISSSCCAQTSYRKTDDTLDKAKVIYDRLVNDRPVHASPFEHCGTPISVQNQPWNPNTWDAGITHVMKNGTLCSGNFHDWIQYRQLIPDNYIQD